MKNREYKTFCILNHTRLLCDANFNIAEASNVIEPLLQLE